MSEVDSVTTESSDDSQTRPSVFRRVMARDIYDLRKRLEQLEQDDDPVPEPPEKIWSYAIPALVLLPLVFAAFLYVGYRIDSVGELLTEETEGLRDELELRQYMIDELQQIVRQQAIEQREIVASETAISADITVAADEVDASDAASNGEPADQDELREALPASLEPGQVLLIVASTAIKEEAVELAQALERDGHDSEVVLGLIGYYGVALGRFDLNLAKSTKLYLVENGIVNSMPYFMTDALIDSYIYP